jgi:hypothetical protein
VASSDLLNAFWDEAALASGGRTQEWADKKIVQMRGALFEEQLALMDDPCRFRSVLCNRRAGKTTAFAVILLSACLRRPESLVAYVTMTKGVAKRNIWGMLRKYDEVYELGIKWNNTELSGVFQNGSKFFLAGADNTGEVDKLRGVPLDGVIFDESKSFPTGNANDPDSGLFQELMDEVVGPTLSDRMGWMMMGGTPGCILAGPFYKATSPSSFFIQDRIDGTRHAISRPYTQRKDPEWDGVAFEWSHHRWSSRENAAMPHIWAEQLNEKKRKGWSDDAPVWRREYLAEWVADDNGMVYRYLAERDSWTPDPESDNEFGLPSGHDWRYVLGADLGYDDDFAIEVGAYSDTHPQFFEVYDFASPGFTVSDVARKIREVEAKFGEFEMMVGDSAGLGKAIFAELAEVHGIVIEPAKKRDKRDHIEILNSNLMSGLVKIRAGSRLGHQMTYLQWGEDGRKEDKAFPNHNCDAWLYLIRHSLHHQYRPMMSGPEHHGDEWKERQRLEEIKHLESLLEPQDEDEIFYDYEEDFEGREDILREIKGWRTPTS